ncbi:hypothetical protein ACFQS3_02355 [Glycomyces mayteni]|uniref:Uncharacterized protein n=1 Tax=Glycomyces mayteni TaxID=543887 RepID=A0ABW2D171_9ACTN|nr:hypothetical protein GCM10025732_47680 [Glycomyces mayteni]
MDEYCGVHDAPLEELPAEGAPIDGCTDCVAALTGNSPTTVDLEETARNYREQYPAFWRLIMGDSE